MIYPVDISDLPQVPTGVIDARARERYVSYGMWPRAATPPSTSIHIWGTNHGAFAAAPSSTLKTWG